MTIILQVRANTIRSIVLVDNQLDEKGNPADLKTPPRTITWAESPKKRTLYSRSAGIKISALSGKGFQSGNDRQPRGGFPASRTIE